MKICARTFLSLSLLLGAFFGSALVSRPVAAETIYGIATQSARQYLLNWDSADPTNVTAQLVTNLDDYPIYAIDFRPEFGGLYALAGSGVSSSNLRIVRINPATAAVFGPQYTG